MCFRVAAGKGPSGALSSSSSKRTAALVEKVNGRGKIALNSTVLGSEGHQSFCVARMAIGGSNTTGSSVELAWRELVEVARGLKEE